MSDCIFCKIIDREIPAGIVHETDKSLAFLDIAPLNQGHTLVIPKYHAETLSELPRNDLMDTMEAVQQVVKKLEESTLTFKDFNILLANGVNAGQEISHLHFHIIPRSPGDFLNISFAPDRPKLSGEEISHIANIINK